MKLSHSFHDCLLFCMLVKEGFIICFAFQVVKVADFGVARVKTQSGVMTAETGTYRWMAPEVLIYFILNQGASNYKKLFESVPMYTDICLSKTYIFFNYICFL